MIQHSFIKEQLLNLIRSGLDEKIEMLEHSIMSAKEARNNDTKSSAGDKFETGREMMQAEINKNENLLATTKYQCAVISKINPKLHNEKVGLGSLVFTNNGNYLLSMALGKYRINNETFYALSLASPIGKLLSGKKKNDRLIFNHQEIIILDIIG